MTKVIKTDEQYNSALAEVEGLLDSEPQPETEEADKLELLALLSIRGSAYRWMF